MNREFGFQQLVDLCRQTHQEMQRQAVRSVDAFLVVRNWLFGGYIVEYEQEGADRAQYAKETLRRLSAALKEELGRGFSVDSLEQMRRFFLAYRGFLPSGARSETLSRISGQMITGTAPRKSELPRAEIAPVHGVVPPEKVLSIPQTASALLKGGASSSAGWQEALEPLIGRFSLGWSHYVELLTIENPDERHFYEIEAAAGNWSVRELERQIASSLYERLALSGDKKEIQRLAREGHIVEKAADLIKNPLVLEFLNLPEKRAYSEDDIESAIIDRLEDFLLELGKGFLFEARQKRFTFDNDHFFVDLVFYNRLLHCYVLIDLKRDKLTHQDLGQMQMYVNYFDRHRKAEEELPTVGIVLCRRKNDALVELTLPKNANVFASKYQLYLPSKEELKTQLLRIEAELEAGRERQT